MSDRGIRDAKVRKSVMRSDITSVADSFEFYVALNYLLLLTLPVNYGRGKEFGEIKTV